MSRMEHRIFNCKNLVYNANTSIEQQNNNFYNIEEFYINTFKNKFEKCELDGPVTFCISEPVTSFVGRTEEIQNIDYLFGENNTVALCGPAGIGKSELAKFYIHERKTQYNGNVIWITAENANSIENSFRKLAAELFLSDCKDIHLFRIVEEVYSYFKNTPVLFIFDNVPHKRLIHEYLPTTKILEDMTMKIILTSQFVDWKNIPKIDVKTLDAVTALQLFCKVVGDDIYKTASEQDWQDLAKVFHYIPLGLQMASSYLNRMLQFPRYNYSVKKYISDMQERDNILEKKFPRDSDNAYEKSIYIALQQTVDIILKDDDKDGHLAVAVLNTCAHLPPDEISIEDMLHLSCVEDFENLYEACYILQQYGLIQLGNSDNTKDGYTIIKIHRLMQRCIQYDQKKNGATLKFYRYAFTVAICKQKIYLPTIYVLQDTENLKKVFEDMDRDQVKQLIDKHKLLHNAVCKDLFNTAKLLFDYNANPNSQIEELLYETPLCIAIANSLFLQTEQLEPSEKCIQLLISQGAQLEKLNKFEDNVLHVSALSNNVKLLNYFCNKFHININLKNAKGHTTLHKLFFYTNIKNTEDIKRYKNCISTILTQNGNIDSRDNNGLNLLHWAAVRRSIDLMKFLIEEYKMDPYTQTYNGDTLLHLIFILTINTKNENTCKECIKFLLNYDLKIDSVNKYNWTLLHSVSWRRNVNLIEFLIKEYHLNPNSKDDEGNTPLHIVLHEEIESEETGNNCIECIGYLVKHGANSNAINNNNWTILHWAARQRSQQLLTFIFDTYRIGLNSRDIDNRTPLHTIFYENIKTQFDVQRSKECIECLFNYGATITTTDNNGWTMLHWATYYRCSDLIIYLIENYKMDSNAKDINGRTPMHIVFYDSITTENELKCIECVEELLKYGTKTTTTDNNGWTILHWIAAKRSVKLLDTFIKEYKMDPNTPDVSGRTPLFSIFDNDVKVVEDLQRCKDCILCLMNHGANITLTDNDNSTLLHWVAFHRNLYIIKFLTEAYNINVNTQNIDGCTPLHILFKSDITRKEDIDLCKEIIVYLEENGANINIIDANGWTLLHWAAYQRVFEIIDLLTSKYNAGTNILNNQKKTALNIVFAKYINTKDDEDKCITCFDSLVKAGADIHTKDNRSWNLLHWAAFRRNERLISFLIEKHNFNPNINDIVGRNALHMVFTENINNKIDADICEKCIKCLVNYNADINISDLLYGTVLHYAVRYRCTQIINYLITEYKMDVNIKNTIGKTPLYSLFDGTIKTSYDIKQCVDCFVYLVKLGADVHIKTEDNQTLLHWACYNRIAGLIEFLITNYDIDPNGRNNYGKTAVHLIFASKIETQQDSEKCIECFKVLIKNGVDINIADKNGLTSLHYAVYKQSIDLVMFFIENCKLNPNIEDIHGNTPLHIATNVNMKTKNDLTLCNNIIKYLINHKANIYILNKFGATVIHFAVLHHNLEIIKLLIEEHHMNPSILSLNGKTLLHIVFEKNVQAIDDIIVCKKCFRYLAQHYETVNVSDSNGCTVLHIAAKNRNIFLLEFLVETYEMDVNKQDYDYDTPLHMLLETSIESDEDLIQCKNCITYLIKHNADINAVNKNKWTMLHLAAYHRNTFLIKFLIEGFHMDCNAKRLDGKNVLNTVLDKKIESDKDAAQCRECITCLLKYKADITDVDNDGRMILHYVAVQQNLQLVIFLLETYNVSTNIQDVEGKTPLHCLFETNAKSEETIKKCIQILVLHKADISAEDNNSWTILHWAVFHRNYAIIKFLIEEYKLNPNIETNKHETILHILFMKPLLSMEDENNCKEIVTYVVQQNVNFMCTAEYRETILQLPTVLQNLQLKEFLEKFFQLNTNKSNVDQ